MIHCCGCNEKVEARLTNGAEIYPHRPDLHGLPFWRCDRCKNYVGCHHKTKNRTRPLGNIPTKELREARKHIHAILDPMWKSRGKGNKRKTRTKIYERLSEQLGWKYHTACIRSVDEARKVYRLVVDLRNEMSQQPTKESLYATAN